ncbi:MAG: hypothetical protein K5637_01745 [Lachnospiraceae bacterium]|nr:hypothetical protein [Lachnospiraceae bacterium]
MVKNKRGRKSNTVFGYANRVVETWAKYDGEWVYQGLCGKRLCGVTSDGEYDYYTISWPHSFSPDRVDREYRQAK